MSDADDYRQYAKECAEWARSASSEAEREQLLDLARVWLTTARRLEGVVVPSVPREKSLRVAP